MFYLLEDNRIIEWNGDCIIKEVPKNINGVYKMKKCIIFKSETIKDVFVKKQSGNVFDLIDWNNDLVRLTFKDGKSLIVYCNINKSEFNDGFYDVEWISAIYKPDKKGNYIKVWERKKE